MKPFKHVSAETKSEIVKSYMNNPNLTQQKIADMYGVGTWSVSTILTKYLISKTMYNVFCIELINGEKSEPIERSINFENRKEMDRARRLLSRLIGKRAGHKTDVFFHYKTI